MPRTLLIAANKHVQSPSFQNQGMALEVEANTGKERGL